MTDPRPLLLYIHGFNSAPQSHKATVLGHYIHKGGVNCDYEVPALGEWPGENARALLALASEALQTRPVYIVGSSLGGYYGTWLMNRLLESDPAFPVKLVLVNPAVKPYERFLEYLGPQKNYYSEETYELTHKHIDQLKLLDVITLPRPDNILLLAQTGDETLDYRQAMEHYSECPQRIDEGGSHSFDDFDDSIPVILSFFSPLLAPSKPL